MDKLKQFIDDNRDAFDNSIPGPGVFKKIQGELPGDHKKKFNWQPYRWAAMVAGVLLVSAAFYFFSGRNKDSADKVADIPAEEKIEAGDPVYAKQIYYFKEIIGLKQNELKQLEKEYPQLYKQFVGDIDQLDSSYQALKIKLAENPNREMLLEAMIQNLQLQSELLNRQLLIIKEVKQQKSKSHEKDAI